MPFHKIRKNLHKNRKNFFLSSHLFRFSNYLLHIFVSTSQMRLEIFMNEYQQQKSPLIGRYARIIMDDWFKRTFGDESRKRLLQLFLEELIPERKITQLTLVNTEHINPLPDNRNVRIDVECTDEDGVRFIVEMQIAKQTSFYSRAVYYSTFGVQKQLRSGGDSDDYAFPTVYFIGLMDFSFHKGSDEVKYRYLLKRDCSDEIMTDHLQYIFLELPNCKNALTPQATVLENFCYALHNMEHMKNRPPQLKEEIFKLLFESAEIANFTPEEKAKYERDMTTERDIRNYISCARQEGREEGLEAGKKEGIKEGAINAKIEIAKAFLEKGIAPETVASCTGLSIDEIEKLK